MAQDKFKRKLTTIFSADVAGYSRLMAKAMRLCSKWACNPISGFGLSLLGLVIHPNRRIHDDPS